MRIFLFSQFFPPETGAAPQRAFCHAKNWSKMGHKVTVITNFPNSPIGKIYKGYNNRILKKEKLDNISVIRLLTIPSGKNSSVLKRFISSLTYLFMTMVCWFQTKPDIVIGSAPYFGGFAAFVMAKIRRIPIIYELRDPWLQILEKNTSIPNVNFKILEKIEKFMLNRSDEIVVIGNKMSQVIQKHYHLERQPIAVFNGIEPAAISNISKALPIHIQETMQGIFRIGFIGNLGVWYDYRIIIETAKHLKNDKIAFFILGEGKLKKDFMQEVSNHSLTNIHFFEILPHEYAIQFVRSCDLTILPFRKGICDLCLPLKFFESLGIGTPVMVCNGEEVNLILTESKSGESFDDNKPQLLAKRLKYYSKIPQELIDKGKNGQEFISKNYNRWTMAKKYEQILLTIMKNRKIATQGEK